MSNEQHEPEGSAAPEDEVWTFPAWHNKIPPLVFGVIGPVATIAVIGLVWYYFSPQYTDVGYMPVQPVPYSHKLHAGDLGIDCRYCHTGVERSAVAGVPPTQTCMNCHTQIQANSPNLLPVRASWASGDPVEWVRIHKTPDYAYFQHDAHIRVGIGCESCHGRIDQMVEVSLAQPLSMSWCLDCHRQPEMHLRPRDKVTVMGYQAENQLQQGKELKEKYGVNPPIHCSGCHR
jgi:hypothetical protein